MHDPTVAEAILAELPAGGDNSAYFEKMWRDALGDSRPETGPRQGKRPFPYVPFSPEDHGLPLTPDSVLLDVGCLAGYGLYDFHTRRIDEERALPCLVGLDIDPESVEIGRRLARLWAEDGRVTFCLASCEALPHAPAAVDLIVARSVLPYVRVDATLAEFARVLRPGGLALIQVHAPGYYWWGLTEHLRHPRSASYYLRPLLSRVTLELTGRQPEHRWFRETALETDKLVDLCRRHGLTPVWSQPDRYHPMVLFRRLH